MRHAVALAVTGVLIAGCASSPGTPTAGLPAGAPVTASGVPSAPAGGSPQPGRLSAPPMLPSTATVSLQPATADEGDYRLAAKDQITVTVYGQDDMTRTVRVSQSGTITLPLLGEIQAAGLSPTELETKNDPISAVRADRHRAARA